MGSKKQPQRSRNHRRRVSNSAPRKNKVPFGELVNSLVTSGLFSIQDFHGNIKWDPKQLAVQALLWAWQETKFVTDAFDHAAEACADLGMKATAQSYTSLINALERYHDVFSRALRERFQTLAKECAGRHFKINGWVPIGFDGSRATAPRTGSNERAFCAPNYGQGKRAKYGKKKSKGLRRKRNKKTKTQPQAPQAWITMLWHMGTRLPWTWRLGPSNSSERDHVKQILHDEGFDENTLFCGDAGFTGYPLWSLILKQGCNFLVRVGGNVSLLHERADVKKIGGGIVLCWPKGKMDAGEPPLRLRLIRVTIGKTKMWMLTSVLDRRELTVKMIIRFYKMRWGIEVEFRGLKQTIDKHKLRCRNSNRLLVELDWSLRAMAMAELLAFREQVVASNGTDEEVTYDPFDRSLANTMRVLRTCMRNLHKYEINANELANQLSQALVQRYNNKTDKRARYRPKNPDKKPLGDPEIRKLNAIERKKLQQFTKLLAA